MDEGFTIAFRRDVYADRNFSSPTVETIIIKYQMRTADTCGVESASNG